MEWQHCPGFVCVTGVIWQCRVVNDTVSNSNKPELIKSNPSLEAQSRTRNANRSPFQITQPDGQTEER